VAVVVDQPDTVVATAADATVAEPNRLVIMSRQAVSKETNRR
jgi:hypothetical protein